MPSSTVHVVQVFDRRGHELVAGDCEITTDLLPCVGLGTWLSSMRARLHLRSCAVREGRALRCCWRLSEMFRNPTARARSMRGRCDPSRDPSWLHQGTSRRGRG
jgi:hypothetical protein